MILAIDDTEFVEMNDADIDSMGCFLNAREIEAYFENKRQW